MKRFFDTNILVYAASDDPKRAIADHVLRNGGVISAQVLNEYVNVARKKLRKDWLEVERSILRFRLAFDQILPVTADLNAAALTLARGHSVAFYDALIVAAALEAGCDTLFSEDMQHGRTFGGLTICNPFREGAAV